jgi:carboxylate-amine ligase
VGTPFRESAPDLDGHDPTALVDAAREAAEGVTFGGGPFHLDPVPRVIAAADWAALEAGLLQRVRALDAFCADVYGERRIVRDGVMPARVIDTIDTLEPAMSGRELDRWVAIAGLDVVRAPDGRFLVLEDNLRTPSGMAYAVAARVTALMLLQPEDGPVAVDGLRDMLRLALGEGRAALLTDGPSNTAHWEHQWLAELLEIPLVEPDGFDPGAFDVVYRRTNAWQLDSPVGRLLDGRVRVVNAYGVGVGDDKLAHAYVEDMVRYYLGEEPGVPSVRTYDLGRPEVAEEAIDRIEELVIKPRAGYGGEGVVICPHAEPEDVARVREAVRAAPEDYIAQELIPLSEHRTVIDGRFAFRHVDLRPFVFLGEEEGRVLPGGLTRVALDEGALVVNSSQNGGAKDTWVL